MTRQDRESHRLAVCSWSLRATSPQQLVSLVASCSLRAVQLHLDPVRDGSWDERETIECLESAGIRIIAGMMSTKGEDYTTLESIKQTGGVRIDEHWSANRQAAEGNAALAQRLGVKLVTLHAGFLPHERGDHERATMIQRVRELARVFANRGVSLALETGQERADTLLDVLAETNAELEATAHVGVNFDPANMILYGMGDPVQALRQLLPHVRQVHIKDAVPTSVPGTWGKEVPVDRGLVDWPAFFEVLRGHRVPPLVIEREAGDDRVLDVRVAVQLVQRSVPGAWS